MNGEVKVAAGESRHEDRPGGRRETPAAGGRDHAERESEPPPHGDEQFNASTDGLPPPADPANWVDHED